MSYKALYRKYRPTTFEEVSGQQYIVKILKNALATNKIGHAYLFAGPRGTGKTSLAKIFAKALNCEEGLGHTCNHCKNCEAINEGSHPDIIEIDAASNNGVEEVRDLIDKVRYSTILGRYKVYIIDEVHMMTPGAFNALLKTLEEPPEHVIFILATTEPHKILPTILSRCQRFDFSKLSDEEVRGRLHFVLENEGVTYEEEAVDLIISLCDGGMRDALSILDQVLAYSQNNLKAEDVLNIFSLESNDEKIALLSDAATHDTSAVLQRVNNYITKGSDIKRLTNDLLMIFKDALVYKKTRSGEYLEILNEEQVSLLCQYFEDNAIIEAINILLETLKDYKNVSSINPIFTIALLKLSNLDNDVEEKPVPAIKKVVKPKEVIKPVEEVKVEPKIEPIKPDTIVEEVKVEEKPIVQEIKKEDIKQQSLFDTFDEDKLDPTITRPFDGKVIEDINNLSGELLLDIIITATKDMKNKLLAKWDQLAMLGMHPTLGAKATLLNDAHLLVATKSIMLVEYDLDSMVKKVNLASVQGDLQKITQIAFGKKMFIYALNRLQSVELQQKFINLKQIGKLPKANTIEIKMIGE